MDKNLLKAKIVQNGFIIGQVAVVIGVNEAALYSRLSKSSKKPFTFELASKFSTYLGLSSNRAYEIFLKEEN